MGVDAAIANMEPVPGGKMASNWPTPNIPKLEIVNVPGITIIIIIIMITGTFLITIQILL